MKRENGSLFVADLGSVKLPKELEREVAGEIQAVIMKALATTDFKGDVRRGLPDKSIIDWPDHTMGIWIDPNQEVFR